MNTDDDIRMCIRLADMLHKLNIVEAHEYQGIISIYLDLIIRDCLKSSTWDYPVFP